MASFDHVADEYEAGRPAYPAGVYDALGPLDGLLVLDGGAGTGIATRQLLDRGATVIALDAGHGMLLRAASRTAGLPAVVADGAMLPLPDQRVDLTCFAQAWHWLDPSRRCAEVHRVLRDGGRWAGWWSHARADGEDWFDRYWSAIEAACPGTTREQRDVDWGAELADSGLFSVGPRVAVPWTREISVDAWMTDQASHSYVATLDERRRDALLRQLRGIVAEHVADGRMTVRYETWLWVASRR